MARRERPLKKRFTSYLTEHTLGQLLELSDKTRITQASLVEEAISDLLVKYYGILRKE